MIEKFHIFAIDADPGRIGICRLPGRDGALADDVAAIRDWGPALVVSLTEMAEMDALGSLGLQEMLAAAVIEWRHFPIADFGIPPAEADPQWRTLADELHAALDAGQSVLVHCRGGLGRSGMAAARLLAERGASAAEAIARVRADRPGAVETDAQEGWIGNGPGLEPRQTMPTTGLGR